VRVRVVITGNRSGENTLADRIKMWGMLLGTRVVQRHRMPWSLPTEISREREPKHFSIGGF
jgi:hypothetical protein